MKIIDVFAVYGDFGNVGGGNLIGIFENIKDADEIAKGRGSLDCGGDGKIVEKKAIEENGEYYLLELNFPISLNKELSPDPRYKSESYGIIVTKIDKSVEFMRLLRKRTGMSIRETKDFMEAFYSHGKAQIPPSRDSFDGTYLREDAISWKQEAELNGIARLELE